jgi:hypothetical protein
MIGILNEFFEGIALLSGVIVVVVIVYLARINK